MIAISIHHRTGRKFSSSRNFSQILVPVFTFALSVNLNLLSLIDQYVKLLELFMKSKSEGPTQHSGIKAQGLVSEFHTVFKILYSFLSYPSLYLIIIF